MWIGVRIRARENKINNCAARLNSRIGSSPTRFESKAFASVEFSSAAHICGKERESPLIYGANGVRHMGKMGIYI